MQPRKEKLEYSNRRLHTDSDEALVGASLQSEQEQLTEQCFGLGLLLSVSVVIFWIL